MILTTLLQHRSVYIYYIIIPTKHLFIVHRDLDQVQQARPFFDERGLQPGDEAWPVIERAIEEAIIGEQLWLYGFTYCSKSSAWLIP